MVDETKEPRYDGPMARAQNEREPVFVARMKVALDGQEWPPTATEYAEARLRQTLEAMVADKTIISFELVTE